MKSPFHVYKFGGASVRDANAIRKVAAIVRASQDVKLLVVISAMGKTTNALERVVGHMKKGSDFRPELNEIRAYHQKVMTDLIPKGHGVWLDIDTQFKAIENQQTAGLSHDQLYDQVVSRGELMSTMIVSAFLESDGINTKWVDVRAYIRTDDCYREGKVDWEESEKRISGIKSLLEEHVVITQGFLGGNTAGFTTTLGREGSDYTAAIFGSCLPAANVTIWKDVPGVMNADPKRIPDAVPFEELPFREAAEMTYYGASVIHPKTIKPLANRSIPLLVKNFDDPTLPGTVIHEVRIKNLPPLIVFKENQCLISCGVTDYTFIDEQQLSLIFNAISELNMKINVMQNSAISFSFCVDYREEKVQQLIEVLAKHFEVYYNTGLMLITVKNYDDKTYQAYRQRKGIILEQTSRSTLQLLIRN